MSTLKARSDERYADTSLPRIRILVAVQAVWMVLLVGLLEWFGSFSFESFYVFSYVGLAVNAQLFAPVEPAARWWRTVKWFVRLGFLGLCYFVAVRVTDVTQV
ncbi:hypothetical protein [Halovenus marina]|uniref:hypothetical protein n=1 Tax=Halovenus marina TaxID=3396621 RepID=UPI003F54C60E